MASLQSLETQGSSEVIVVGAGGCGLTAALAAAQKGSNVLVLEKTNGVGGTTALSHGGVPGAGTRFQRAEGIEDDPTKFAEEILQRNSNQSDIKITECLAQSSAALVEWLADTTGVALELSTLNAGHKVRRSHAWGWGEALIENLRVAVEDQKKIRLACSTPVLCLSLDENGAVTGVVTEGGTITGNKVILAAGGFGASSELLSQHIPKAADLPYGGHVGSTGDGLRLGTEVGAATENLGAFQPYPSFFTPRRLPIPQDVLHMGGIQVDERGWRFANETLFPGGLGAKMLDLPGKHSYEIFDEYIYQAAQDRLAKVAEAGILKKADTADELGSRLGVNPIALARTIERYNNCAGRGVDEFGRTVLAPLGLPLFGIEVWVAMYHTQGGLKVNTNAQVLRPDGSLVPNLYAGGGTASGISGSGADGYFPGNGLLAALGLGKLAGEHAAGCVAVGT